MTYEPGIYFGMNLEEYLAIPALSSSDLKSLLVCPADYYMDSFMHQSEEETQESTEAQIIGSAYHTMILEGQEAFTRKYAPKFDAAMIPPDVIRTVDDLKAELRRHMAPVSGTKPELIKRLLELDPDAPIEDVMKDRYLAENAGKIFLKRGTIDRILISSAYIRFNYMLKPWFTDGMPEVVVVWESPEFPDVLYKARFDYLRPDTITDLKTFTNTRIRKIDKAVMDAMMEYKYHIQFGHYREAGRMACEHAKSGVFHFCGEDVDQGAAQALIDGLAQNKEQKMMFVFQKKEKAPIARGYIPPHNTMFEGAAKASIREATQIYVDNLAKFGTELWVDDSDITYWSDLDMPERMTEF